MNPLSQDDHIFRYIGGGSFDGDFLDPAAFRRKIKQGKLEAGLSVNWFEWFEKTTPQEAVKPLRETLEKKDFKIGATSWFALLNVGTAKNKAAEYTTISIVLDEQPNDKSHSLVTDYNESLNDQVAEQLKKAVIALFPAKGT